MRCHSVGPVRREIMEKSGSGSKRLTIVRWELMAPSVGFSHPSAGEKGEQVCFLGKYLFLAREKWKGKWHGRKQSLFYFEEERRKYFFSSLHIERESWRSECMWTMKTSRRIPMKSRIVSWSVECTWRSWRRIPMKFEVSNWVTVRGFYKIF